MLRKNSHFIVIGGHKCGTSSLHIYLQQHPDICMPKIKGVDFFSRLGNSEFFQTFDDYINLYDRQELSEKKVSGEISSVYLSSDKARQAIKNYLPDAKLIVIVRNPVDRAISHILQVPEVKIDNYQKLNLSDFLTHKKVLRLGYYSQFIRKYLEEFPRENIHFCVFDSLIIKSNFTEFFNFIGVDPNFQPDTSVIMRKGGTIKPQDDKILDFLRSTFGQILKPITTPEQRRYILLKVRNLMTKKYKTSQDIKAELYDLYREDILETQALINLDLSNWLIK